MTAEEADAPISQQSVKPVMELERDGTNFNRWRRLLDTQAIIKRCHMALYRDYPGTAVDAAATVV